MRTVTILIAVGIVWLAEFNPIAGQSPDSQVMATIQQVFDGMRSANSIMVSAVFADDARFAVIRSKDGNPEITTQPVFEWIGAIGESGGNWDERIYDVDIHIDGNVSSAWVPYTFYLEGVLSHCGVNSMELLLNGDSWEITQLSDSRRTKDCPDPLGEQVVSECHLLPLRQGCALYLFLRSGDNNSILSPYSAYTLC